MGTSPASSPASSASASSLRKGHHCAYDIHYHFVFRIKYRRALLASEVVAELVRLGLEISERYDIEIECFGADKDHVHLLCSAHPKMAPGQIVRIYKSITARELFKTFPQLKKELWGGEFWSDGYYVATAATSGSWAALVRYVKNQGQQPDAVNLQLLFPVNPGLDHPGEK